MPTTPAGQPANYYLRDVYTRCIFSRVSVPLTLLGLLEREPSHGYDLKRGYDTYFGRGKQLPFGQVYATLGRLAELAVAVNQGER
jgi:DNA-binding PadR family transcriptional regulator